MQLNSLAQDLARAKGIDLATATDIVTKAAQGNGKALKGLGVDISGAKTAADFLAAAQRNVKGAAEEWANTSDGKLAAANVTQSEAWERIGSVVDKISTVVIPIAADAFSAFADLFVSVANQAQPLIDALISGLAPVIQQVSAFISGTLAPAFQGFMAFISGTVVPVLTDLASTVIPFIATAVQPVIDALTGSLIPAFQAVIGIVSQVVGWFASKIPDAINFLKPIVGALGNVFKTEMAIIGKAIDVVGGVISWLVKMAGPAFDAIGGFFSGLADTAGKVFNGIATVVGRVWNGVTSTIKGAINAVVGAINSVIRGINSIQVHIHLNPPIGPDIGFDWNGLNIGYLPYLHTGGIVPGAPGSDVLAVLQAGEKVIPRDQVKSNSGGNINIYIDGSVYGDLDQLARDLAMRLRTVNA